MTLATFQRDRRLASVSISLGMLFIVTSNILVLFDVEYYPVRYSMAIIAVCLIFGPGIWMVAKYRSNRGAMGALILATVMIALGMAFETSGMGQLLLDLTGLEYSKLRHIVQDSLNEIGVSLVFASVVALLISASQKAWEAGDQEQQLRKVNRDLAESQQRLSEAQAVANLGSWSWNADTDETVWSEHMYRILGVNRDAPPETAFESIDRMVHPDDHARVRRIAEEIFKTGQPRSAEFRVIRSDTQERIFCADGTVEIGSNGKVVSILGTLLDVTERRRMHDELERRVEERTAELAQSNDQLRAEVQERRQAEAGLKESEQRFREMAENIDAVVWIQDASNGRILYVSPACEEIWRMSAEELRAQPQAWAKAIHPDDRDRVRAQFRKAMRAGLWQPYRSEYRLLWPDGSVRWIQDRGFPIHDESGKVCRIGGVATDITEQRAAAETLRHADRLAVIGTLAAGIAHEINNPVGSILLSAQLAEKQMLASNGPDAVTSQLTSIISDANRCGRIVKSVLAFSRSTLSEKQLEPLNDVVRSAEVLARKYAVSNKATLRLQLEEDLPNVMINSIEIEQVLINAIRNAVESKSEGVAVDIKTCLVNGRVAIQVRDDGRGIPENEMRRIFDPFYTTRRSQGGTGLGLSISYGIVREHGGSIHVESNVGGGTCVTIELPVAADT